MALKPFSDVWNQEKFELRIPVTGKIMEISQRFHRSEKKKFNNFYSQRERFHRSERKRLSCFHYRANAAKL
jgi:hypothetical protein